MSWPERDCNERRVVAFIRVAVLTSVLLSLWLRRCGFTMEGSSRFPGIVVSGLSGFLVLVSILQMYFRVNCDGFFTKASGTVRV